jgi:hypothetical protein
MSIANARAHAGSCTDGSPDAHHPTPHTCVCVCVGVWLGRHDFVFQRLASRTELFQGLAALKRQANQFVGKVVDSLWQSPERQVCVYVWCVGWDARALCSPCVWCVGLGPSCTHALWMA